MCNICLIIYVYFYSHTTLFLCMLVHVQNDVIDTKKAYVRFIGHELRTPLNSVFMGMQLSIGQIPEDTQDPVEVERRETLVETKLACGAALDILNELLLFDKLETGALMLHKQNVPVCELVEDSLKMFSAQAREKRIELLITNNDETVTTVIESDRCETQLALYDTDGVFVDKNKVVQVIRNVVSNAIKFTPSTGKIQVNLKFEPFLQSTVPAVAPRVALCCGRGRVVPIHDDLCDSFAIEMDRTSIAEVDAGRQAGELVIEIKDNGAGISEENQRRLFKEVVQFNPELLQNGGGSGLGMCISKSLIEMHGGSIGVRSGGEGRGCVFTLRLPMIQCKKCECPTLYIPLVFSAPSQTRSVVPNSASARMQLLCTEMPPEDRGGCVRVPDERLSLDRSSISSTGASRPLRFLVVDDSKMNRKMLCRLLKNKGHDCAEAEDGVEALAMFASLLPSRPVSGNESTTSAKMECKAVAKSPKVDVTESVGYDAILMDFMYVFEHYHHSVAYAN